MILLKDFFVSQLLSWLLDVSHLERMQQEEWL